MIHAKKFYQRFRLFGIGPGGWSCPCCVPKLEHKARHCRKAKRGREKQYFARFIREQM
jgi:hypothetical protein